VVSTQKRLVVVEKPSGVSTVRHPAERQWDEQRRKLVPTLDDVTQQAIAFRLACKWAASADVPRCRKRSKPKGW